MGVKMCMIPSAREAGRVAPFFGMKTNFLAVMVIGALAGCASWNDDTGREPGLDLPGAYGGGTNTPPGVGWLGDFNDPALNSLVVEALQNNPDVKATAARLRAALADVRIARADQLPQLDVTLANSRTKRNNTGGFSLRSSRVNRFSPSLDLSWELDVWGRLADSRKAAALDAESFAANLRAARLSLAANAVKAWFDIAEAELQVALAGKTLESYRQNLKVLEEGLLLGLNKALDVRLMRTNVHAAESALESARRTRDAARRALETLLGRYPKSTLVAAAALPTLDQPVPTGLPSQLLDRRPDLVAARKTFHAAHRRVAAARKELLPQIRLTATGGTTSNELKDVLNINNNIWQLAANLTQPLFRGGRLRAQAARAGALRDEARHNYVQTALTAFGEVETALAAEGFLKQEELARRAHKDEAALAAALALVEYRNGLVEIVTVLESDRRSFEAQRAWHTVRNQRLQNRLDLYKALGGDFAASPEAPENGGDPNIGTVARGGAE